VDLEKSCQIGFPKWQHDYGIHLWLVLLPKNGAPHKTNINPKKLASQEVFAALQHI